MLRWSFDSLLSARAMKWPSLVKTRPPCGSLGYLMYETDLSTRDQSVTRSWKSAVVRM